MKYDTVYGEITVGPKGADVTGESGRHIQMAIDALSYQGGGTVRGLPREYLLDDSVRLRPSIRLIGNRDRTILRRRGPLTWSPLALDADTSETQITPEDASRFRVGMSVCCHDERPGFHFGWAFGSSPYVVTRIEDGVLHLHEHLTDERYVANNGIVVNWFPLIRGHEAHSAVVDGFTCDSAIDDPEHILSGLRASVVYFHRSRNVQIRNVIARNGAGDGICFGKSSEGMLIEDCEMYDNGWYGLHPGSHSHHCTIRRCNIHHNASDGLYICWGIHHSRFEENDIHHNGVRDLRSGISIGHKDTDSLIANNRIYENKRCGIYVRPKTEGNGAHRNTFRGNVIENNGSRADEFRELRKKLPEWETLGSGIHVRGITRDLVFEANTIRENRTRDDATQRHAIVLAEGVSGVRMSGNRIQPHPEDAVVDLSGSADNVLEGPFRSSSGREAKTVAG